MNWLKERASLIVVGGERRQVAWLDEDPRIERIPVALADKRARKRAESIIRHRALEAVILWVPFLGHSVAGALKSLAASRGVATYFANSSSELRALIAIHGSAGI